LNREELRAMALPRSSLLSSMSGRKACRPGMSKAFTQPMKTLRAMMCQNSTVPAKTSAVNMAAWIIARVWVAITTRCRFQRSRKTPINGMSKKLGICEANVTTPRRKAASAFFSSGLAPRAMAVLI
jgi:hypothetical protein